MQDQGVDKDREESIANSHAVFSTRMKSTEVNARSLLKQTVTLTAPDGLQFTNECFNDGAASNVLKGNLKRVGIKFKDMTGQEVNQTHFFIRYSLGIDGSAEPYDKAGNKDEMEQLAKLLDNKLDFEEDD